MKIWDTHQIARWYECYVSVEPSADSPCQPPGHRCGACEAQKRPAGPIVSRSPTSFGFNDVVGLDLFFLNTYEKHTWPAMNIVCWSTGLQRVIPLRDQSGETLRKTHTDTIGCGHTEGLASLLSTSSAACVQAFSRKTLTAMGRRLEVTPLEAPWRNGKTERAGKDWKEDYYKMTQDRSEAQTWTDSEENCDAVNESGPSKIKDSGWKMLSWSVEEQTWA